MKTTIELSDELLNQARVVARREGSSLKRLVEEGLQRTLEAREQRVKRSVEFPTYGGSGLTEAFEAADWARIRDEIYRGRGA